MLLPAGQHVSLEIVVADQEGTRRRLILSTSFCDVKSTPLHARVPLPDALVPCDRWTNLALDLPALTASLWAEQRAEFKSVEGVSVGATCAARKIFTTKSPPQEHGVDPTVQREAARIEDTDGGRRAAADGSLGIRGFGCGPVTRRGVGLRRCRSRCRGRRTFSRGWRERRCSWTRPS